jgi:hypothetical protein
MIIFRNFKRKFYTFFAKNPVLYTSNQKSQQTQIHNFQASGVTGLLHWNAPNWPQLRLPDLTQAPFLAYLYRLGWSPMLVGLLRSTHTASYFKKTNLKQLFGLAEFSMLKN